MKCIVCGNDAVIKLDVVNFPDDFVFVMLFEPLCFCSDECFQKWKSLIKKLVDDE
jgi:hypothetical protein